MPTPSRYAGVAGDECQCGRRASVRHCTVCGSARVYARSNRLHKMLDGTEKYVSVEFRCQACGHLFIEEEREFCDAPPLTLALAQKKTKAINEVKLDPVEAKLVEAVKKMLESPTQSDEIRQKLRTQLLGPYSDMILAESERLGITAEEMRSRESFDAYVKRQLAGSGLESTTSTQEVQEPTNESQIEDAVAVGEDSEQTRMSIEEQKLRKEWGFLKIKGKQPTLTPEEYVERRLKGEVFS